ncbi:MAG: efflux RND transporter periplasmic adaptor subunit [Desulfobacteraceae bacterium]|nr:MAG: efflux RND transporter periplasmic adaptor subunit [Desulfobacteraceae bacterium]
MKNNNNTPPDVLQTLSLDPAQNKKSRLKKWLLILALVPVIALLLFFWQRSQASNTVSFKTKEATQGDLTVTVTATGNLQPTNQVDVGSELSGIVKSVAVDYNSRVKIGQILAKLDTTLLETQVVQSKAGLESAKAKVLQSQATILETRNNLERIQKVRELTNGKTPSQNDLVAAQAALDRALANEAGAKADLAQAQATLKTKQTDLSKTVIRSPINGVVLIRNVEPGQTVAASLQAPVLFTLAENLAQMELHVDVDEADVGQILEGQEARFTVDAFPTRTFRGRITQVRNGAKTANGVVTYETVLSVDNSDLSLRPGMTATAEIIVQKVRNALLVPNAALRFTPPAKNDAEATGQTGFVNPLLPGRHGPPRNANQNQPSKGNGNRKKEQKVWVLNNGLPTPIPVIIGMTDGIHSEVLTGDVTPGLALLVDIVSKKP